jgi:hypothetical protein
MTDRNHPPARRAGRETGPAMSRWRAAAPAGGTPTASAVGLRDAGIAG